MLPYCSCHTSSNKTFRVDLATKYYSMWGKVFTIAMRKGFVFSLKYQDEKSLNINWFSTLWQNWCTLSCVNILSSLSRSIHSFPAVPLRYTLILLILSKSIPTSATLGIHHPHTSTRKWCFRSTKLKSLVEIFACVSIFRYNSLVFERTEERVTR